LRSAGLHGEVALAESPWEQGGIACDLVGVVGGTRVWMRASEQVFEKACRRCGIRMISFRNEFTPIIYTLWATAHLYSFTLENDMASDAVVTRPFIISRPVNRTTERIFFGSMAILLCVVVFIGFSPTYFRAGMLQAPLPSPILHYHGAVFTLWMVLYLIQSALISARRISWHRSLGTIAFCLPPIMIVLGLIAAIDALHRRVSIGPLDPAVSLSIPLLGIFCFAIVIYASWRARRRPDAHKRLILLATIGLTEAALGRFPWGRIPPAAGAVTGLGILVLLVIGYDLISLHRIHRSTLWAAPLTFAVGAFAVPIGMTSAWHSFAAFLDRTLGAYI
jgi:hypothetical protein